MKSTRRQFLDCALGFVGGAISTYSIGMPIIAGSESDLGMKSDTLDLSEARRLDSIGELVVTNRLQSGAGFARLRRYTKVTPEAIQYLSNKNCTSLDLGIHEIDLDILKIFQSWEGLEYLRFNRLKILNAECARGLCSAGVGLRLGLVDVDAVSADVARELAKNHGWLSISLPAASRGAISELSKHQGKTELNLMFEPSYEDAIAITHHQGFSFDLTLPPESPSPALMSALSSNSTKKIEIHCTDTFSWIEINDLGYVDQGGRLRRIWLG